MGFKIGSFNLYKLNFQSNTERRKKFENIANIIVSEEYDIVAFQEVLSEQACKELLINLGPNWEGRWEFPPKSSNMAAEGYAFVWNKMRIHLAQNEEGKYFEPRILNQYKINKALGQTELIRNPYFGRFVPKLLPKLEFRLINVHFRFTKDDEIELSAIKQRQNEYSVLTEAIYPKYEDKRYGNNCAAYTFILGDYNLNIVRPTILDGRDKNCKLDEIVYLDDRVIKTVQDQLTTLKKDNGDDSSDENESGVRVENQKKEKIKSDMADAIGKPQDLYANNYDHFTYNANIEQRLFVLNQRIDAVTKYYNKDAGKYRSEVSDHVPIKLYVEPNTYNVQVMEG